MTAVGQSEPVCLLEVSRVGIAKELDRFRRLFIPTVTDPLEEQERQDVALPVRPIDGRAAQDVGGFPEGGFEILVVCRHSALGLFQVI